MIAQQILNGLALGMGYALIAVGFSLVFGILRLVNFSHGAVYAFGSHMVLIMLSFELGLWMGIFASIVITGILGIIIDKAALRPLREKKSPPIAALITTIGMAHIIQNLMIVWLGSHRRAFPPLFNFGMIYFGEVRINSSQLVMFVVSLVLMAALMLLVNCTKIGLAMRATEQSPKASHLMGINVNFIITFTFFLAGASAAIAGALVSGHYQIVYPTIGFVVGIKAFSAAVLGGIGSLPGSVAGGLIVGVSESMAATFLGSTYRDAVAFVILILVLVIRPTGLFGRKDILKV